MIDEELTFMQLAYRVTRRPGTKGLLLYPETTPVTHQKERYERYTRVLTALRAVVKAQSHATVFGFTFQIQLKKGGESLLLASNNLDYVPELHRNIDFAACLWTDPVERLEMMHILGPEVQWIMPTAAVGAMNDRILRDLRARDRQNRQSP